MEVSILCAIKMGFKFGSSGDYFRTRHSVYVYGEYGVCVCVCVCVSVCVCVCVCVCVRCLIDQHMCVVRLCEKVRTDGRMCDYMFWGSVFYHGENVCMCD